MVDTKERNAAIMKMLDDGFTLHEVARSFDISQCRVRQIRNAETRNRELRSRFPEIYEAAAALGRSEDIAARAVKAVLRSRENWPDIDLDRMSKRRSVGPAILEIIEKAMVIKKGAR